MTVPPVRRWWPLLVPVVWAAAAVLVMRPGALDFRPELRWEACQLVYDPSDIAAFVLRGANASAGRLPGRPDEPDWAETEDVAARLDDPTLRYSDRFYLEYPTATLALFRLGFPTPCEVPPAVADCHHFGVARFVPRNEAEARLWGQFHTAAVIHILLMAAALVGLMLVLRRGYEPGRPAGPVWLCILPAAVFFSLNRFDVVPALATAVGFACLGRGRVASSGVCFAVGAVLKVYPVLFVPVILRYLGPARGARWLLGFAGTVALGVGVSTAVFGWEPTVGPVRVQLDRKLEEQSWTLYGRVLPMSLAHNKDARLVILAAAVAAAVATRPADLSGVLRRCAVVLLVFISLAVFWSPQWVVWFLPLLVPLAAGRRWVTWAAVALDLLNYFLFPVMFWLLWNHSNRQVMEVVAEGLIYVRAGLWAGLAGGLIRDEWTSGQAG